ncbi:fibronectin type III domain-containing protein [Paenibacillus sp. N3/727]|uniref:fibronectin type III domain-containing protein n=1 Tax=Paenibacillus sp. N3/727 TaxID=2925845 RepID=UPI001F52DCE6|nr:fibronectin type III domain-containing protein [Paenibacillus sp. N3/727]UNK19284.1 fibronectin type III domain-containing protein [Paenibacillus sp. N3/727]
MAIVRISANSASYNSISVSASFTSGGGLASYYRFFKNGIGDSPLMSFSSPVSSATKYWTYSSLSGDTYYNLSVTFYDKGMRVLGSDSIGQRTSSPPDTTPPTIDKWFMNGSASRTSVPMYVSASDNRGVSGFYFYLDGSYHGSMYGSSGEYTYTNLRSGTSYSFGVKAFDTTGNTSGMVQYRTSTAMDYPPSIQSWSLSNTGVNSVQMYYSASDDHGINYVYLYLNGNHVQTSYSSNGNYTFTGLQPDTNYTLGVKAVDSAGQSSSMVTYSVRTKKARPTNFDWDAPKVSGGDFNITAVEWNKLAAKINEFRFYKNMSNYSFTRVTTGMDFKATYYNDVINVINSMNPSTALPSSKSAGDSILASDINRIRNSLNSIN